MKQRSVSKRAIQLDKLALALPAEGYNLNITLLYQDSATRKWAREISERMAKLAGPENIRSTWWNISELCEPGVLAGAVSTAMRADVIVVARDAAKRVAYPFYVWAESWLPHRASKGALVALVGSSSPVKAQTEQIGEYLRAVARSGRLEFLLEERELPAQRPAPENPAENRRIDIRAIREALRIEAPTLVSLPNN